jgi:hypothetical protein
MKGMPTEEMTNGRNAKRKMPKRKCRLRNMFISGNADWKKYRLGEADRGNMPTGGVSTERNADWENAK